MGSGGANQKTFRGGSMDIFWNCPSLTFSIDIFNSLIVFEIIILISFKARENEKNYNCQYCLNYYALR